MAFYRKPSPETMKKRREEYKNLYSKLYNKKLDTEFLYLVDKLLKDHSTILKEIILDSKIKIEWSESN